LIFIHLLTDKYLKGVYYQNPVLKEKITAEQQNILDALKEGHPNALSATDLSLAKGYQIAENTAYQNCPKLAGEKEHGEQQDKKEIIIGITEKSKESKRKVKKYYFEDYNYIYNLREDFRLLFAPGYVQYDKNFLAHYEKIRDKNLEGEIYELLIKFLTSAKIVGNSKGMPPGLLCKNCGYNHEARDFIRATLLHLIDGLEMDKRFIRIIRDEGIIEERVHKELMSMTEGEFAKAGEKLIPAVTPAPLKLTSDGAKTTKPLGIPFFRGERIEYEKLEDIPQKLLTTIHAIDNKKYEKVAKHYAHEKKRYISKRPQTFDTTPRPLPNGYFLRTKIDKNRMWKLCQDIITYAGFTASDWKVEY
jgi:hypothetical protein